MIVLELSLFFLQQKLVNNSNYNDNGLESYTKFMPKKFTRQISIEKINFTSSWYKMFPTKFLCILLGCISVFEVLCGFCQGNYMYNFHFVLGGFPITQKQKLAWPLWEHCGIQGAVTQSNFSCNLQRDGDESITRQVAEYILHGATSLAKLWKVRDFLSFPVTCNASFCCERGCEEGVLLAQFEPQLFFATELCCTLQKDKLPPVTAPLTL